MKGELEGQFLELIKPLLEEIKWLEGYGDTHETYLNHKSAFDKMVSATQKAIDAARKEFPNIGKMTNITVSRFEIAAQEWFKKWFGDENE